MFIKKYALNKHVRLLTRLYGTTSLDASIADLDEYAIALASSL